jgi:hypothetical protein
MGILKSDRDERMSYVIIKDGGMMSIYSDYRKIKIAYETICGLCIHNKVCSHLMERRCNNYEFGNSGSDGCGSCVNRFSRYAPDEDSLPCFTCEDFIK